MFLPILGIFLCSLVALVTFSSNVNNFEQMQKKSEKIKISTPFFSSSLFQQIGMYEKNQKNLRDFFVYPRKVLGHVLFSNIFGFWVEKGEGV